MTPSYQTTQGEQCDNGNWKKCKGRYPAPEGPNRKLHMFFKIAHLNHVRNGPRNDLATMNQYHVPWLTTDGTLSSQICYRGTESQVGVM